MNATIPPDLEINTTRNSCDKNTDTAYYCMDQEKEFLLVSYEQIYTCGEKKKSCNLIFQPPLGVRFFDVDVLAPYAVEADQMLIYEVHMLWLTVLEQYKKDPQSMELDVTGRELVLQQ